MALYPRDQPQISVTSNPTSQRFADATTTRRLAFESGSGCGLTEEPAPRRKLATQALEVLTCPPRTHLGLTERSHCGTGRDGVWVLGWAALLGAGRAGAGGCVVLPLGDCGVCVRRAWGLFDWWESAVCGVGRCALVVCGRGGLVEQGRGR